MKAVEFRAIRKRLGLSKHEFALELGYRGTKRNNSALLHRYETGSRQVPLTVASLAWLIGQYFDVYRELPQWPDWPGYELELELTPPIQNDGAEPTSAEEESTP